MEIQTWGQQSTYRKCPTGILLYPSLYLQPFSRKLQCSAKHIAVTTLTFQGHVMSSICHMPFPISIPLELSLYFQPFLRYSAPKTSAHTHTQKRRHVLQPVQCIALDRQ